MMTRRPSSTLLAELLKKMPTMGIARLNDLTPLDRIGVPVASAVRPHAADGQITATQGKGLTHVQSSIGALMEAAERFSCAGYRHICSIPPQELHPHFVNRSVMSVARVDAVKGIDLVSQTSVFLPGSAAVFPVSGWSRHSGTPVPSTSGLAAACSLEDAVGRAILELVERAAVSSFWLEGRGRGIDPDSLQGNSHKLLQAMAGENISLHMVDVSAGAIMPAVKALALDREWRLSSLYVGGAAAAPTLDMAIEKALLEIAQGRAVYIQSSREDIWRHRQTRDLRFDQVEAVFEQIRKRFPVTSCRREESAMGSISTAALLERLAEAGLQEVILVDMTNEALGIPVARVVIPGLRDRFIEKSVERTVVR